MPSYLPRSKVYNEKELKDIVMELKGLGCPVWKIAKLLSISEQLVVRYAGVEG